MNRLLRRTLYAGSAACCGAILWGASQASASGNETPVDQVQQALVANSTEQGADASILNKQININVPVAVLSPGANAGDVTQSNQAANTASASNDNSTTQTVDQAQDASSAGHGGIDQQQSADVSNQTSQSADAAVENRQVNLNVPVALLSPGANAGDVTQSNEASNDASAANHNVTDQAVTQDQAVDAASPTGHGPAGQAAVSQDQAADVANATSQEATAPVTNEQSNEATAPPVPVHHKDKSCGCDAPTPPLAGDVSQSNEATNVAAAGNANHTDQEVGQAQAAESAGGTVVQDQSADVANATDQSAAAAVDNDQSNTVGHDQAKTVGHDQAKTVGHDQAKTVGHDHKDKGKGKDHGKGKDNGPRGPVAIPGDVTQSNQAANNASATNVNGTRQDVTQGQAARATAPGKHRDAVVVQRQSAKPTNATRQAASAPVVNDQANVVERHRWSPGSVTQSNEATNDATAANTNTTAQSVAQGHAASVVADGPKHHGPKGHGPKDHGPKDRCPHHDECTPAPCKPAPCPR